MLVHGAWHGSWCWKRVRKGLRDAGHQVFTPTLTGLGERSHLNSAAVNLSTHIADVVNLLRWEDLSDVILCAHSYGGNVITGALIEFLSEFACWYILTRSCRRMVNACLTSTRQSTRNTCASRPKQPAPGWNVPPIPAERFNVNLGDAAWVNAQCTSQSIASFEEHIRLSCVPSHTHDATHILATGWDNSPFRAAHERAKAKGWKTRTVTCGHEVMLDLPGELTDLLLEFATSAVSSPLVA